MTDSIHLRLDERAQIDWDNTGRFDHPRSDVADDIERITPSLASHLALSRKEIPPQEWLRAADFFWQRNVYVADRTHLCEFCVWRAFGLTKDQATGLAR